MPGTGNASVHNTSLTQRSVLMLTDIVNGKQPAFRFKNGDALSFRAEDFCSVFQDIFHITNFDKPFFLITKFFLILFKLPGSCGYVKRNNGEGSNYEYEHKQGIGFILNHSQHHMQDD